MPDYFWELAVLLLLIILIFASSGQTPLLEDPTGGFPEGSRYRDHSHLTQRQPPEALRTSVSLWAMEGKWALMENRQLFQAVTFPSRHWCKLAGKTELDPLYSQQEHKAHCYVYASFIQMACGTNSMPTCRPDFFFLLSSKCTCLLSSRKNLPMGGLWFGGNQPQSGDSHTKKDSLSCLVPVGVCVCRIHLPRRRSWRQIVNTSGRRPTSHPAQPYSGPW